MTTTVAVATMKAAQVTATGPVLKSSNWRFPIQGSEQMPRGTDDALHFAELRGVRAMIETYPLEKAAEAYARMMSGNAEFRAVLTM